MTRTACHADGQRRGAALGARGGQPPGGGGRGGLGRLAVLRAGRAGARSLVASCLETALTARPPRCGNIHVGWLCCELVVPVPAFRQATDRHAGWSTCLGWGQPSHALTMARTRSCDTCDGVSARIHRLRVTNLTAAGAAAGGAPARVGGAHARPEPAHPRRRLRGAAPAGMPLESASNSFFLPCVPPRCFGSPGSWHRAALRCGPAAGRRHAGRRAVWLGSLAAVRSLNTPISSAAFARASAAVAACCRPMASQPCLIKTNLT